MIIDHHIHTVYNVCVAIQNSYFIICDLFTISVTSVAAESSLC